ncbi:MAG: hypothetical protein II119_03885 [Bacilli bacterium]|nr:hypothetical protein [Bacilli bacterium]
MAKLSKDYASCSITYSDSGVATVELKGASGGKFSGITCTGTKDSMNCRKIQTAAEILSMKVGEGGLIRDDHNELRYQGMTVDNYVTFNNETWRIVGLFNVDGEQRVKLVRNDPLGYYSYDTSLCITSCINRGYGINQWGPSTYKNGTPYEGADLMRELNGDYLDTTLTSNTNWYNGMNDKKTAVFDHTKKLSSEAQKLIDVATWYLGGSTSISGSGASPTFVVNLATQYENERGTKVVVPGTTCSGEDCNDNVVRTTIWTGKVGLIYASDIGYSSANANCKNNLTTNCNSWLKTGRFYWTISPAADIAYRLFTSDAGGNVGYAATYLALEVRPSVYLIPGVQMNGSGTTADPYIFTE